MASRTRLDSTTLHQKAPVSGKHTQIQTAYIWKSH